MYEQGKDYRPEVELNSIVGFLSLVGKLKEIPRVGWTRYPIPESESIADHSFRVAAMAMFLAPKFGVDPMKTTMMLIIHDLGEWRKGDHATENIKGDLPNKEAQLIEEREAIEELLGSVGAEAYMPLYDEFAENKTPEARFANEIDKAEMAMQAREYELAHNVDLNEFYVSAERAIHHPVMGALLSEIIDYKRQS